MHSRTLRPPAAKPLTSDPYDQCQTLLSAYTDLEEVILMDHAAVGQVLDQPVRQGCFTTVRDPAGWKSTWVKFLFVI